MPPTKTPLPAAKKVVVLPAVWYGIEPAAPPDMFVEAVASVAVAAFPVVFWFSVGTSPGTIARNEGVPDEPAGAAKK